MSPNKDAVRLGAELLAVRDYSEKEMTERLMRRGYSVEESRAAAARLVELGLIKISGNDREALRAAAREYLLKKGKDLKPSTLSSLAAYLVKEQDLLYDRTHRLHHGRLPFRGVFPNPYKSTS